MKVKNKSTHEMFFLKGQIRNGPFENGPLRIVRRYYLSGYCIIVDDDPGHRITLRTLIRSWGYPVDVAENGREALSKIQETPFGLILMDIRMAEMDGIEALQKIKAYNPSIPILIMTAYSSVQTAVSALKSGAYDYLTKPLDFDVLKTTLEHALKHSGLHEKHQDLKPRSKTDFAFRHIVGDSSPMQSLIKMVGTIAPSEATVLITGESGTGKELIARCVHENSPRKDRPLITVNCAALTESLLESELFGHEKGAFTGADRQRNGRFVQADGGSIFLDEIGEMPPLMQAKLLRVLQEGEVQRVGSDIPIKTDVRIIAATNKNLKEMVSEERFREDLYYRLDVVHLTLPALRDRRKDIPTLALHFMETYARKNRKTVRGLTPLAMELLIRYSWPGNVRELENAVERAVILLPGEYITEKELPLSIVEFTALSPEKPPTESFDTPLPLEEIEKKAILAALNAADGNKSEAARQLGINRKTLHKKLKRYGMA